MAKTKRLRTLTVANGGNPALPDTPLSIVGTKRWKETVPLHLQQPLANALNYMEANDLKNALWWFGECMQKIPMAPGWEREAKPVLYFGGQVAAQGYFSLKSRDPFHPNLAEWRQVALDLVTAAYEAAPDDPVARHNAGRFYQDIGDEVTAIAHYRHTLLLDSEQVETWGNLGTALYQQGDPKTGWECWERCISLVAEMASGKLSQAYIHLRKGEYAEGWAKYNERWNDLVFQREYGRDAQFKAHCNAQHWTDGTLDGTVWRQLGTKHRLFIHGEQGLGDHVQFARYVSVLQFLGVNIVGLETRTTLKRWMEASFPGVPIFARDVDPLPEFTHHVSTLDLPGILGTTVGTIPEPVRLDLASDERRILDLLDHASRGGGWHIPKCGPLRVGIAWEGAKGNPADAVRSIPAEHLAILADIPGVTWVNLQFAPDAPMTSRAWLGANVVDGTEGCNDCLDTAAVMRGLDLVITVDTLTAHLAGTLGVPTWVLHRFCREWRWLDQGEHSPWYPSIRSLTQTAPGDWKELLTRVRAELEKLAHA